MIQVTASMLRPLSASLLAVALLSCGGTPTAPDPGTDYTLAVAPALITTVATVGGGGRTGVTVAWINCAPQTVDLTLADAPAGMAGVFTPASTSTTSTLNVGTTGRFPPPVGFYHMWVQGVAADVHHRTELDLAVQDFTLAQPADATAAAGPSSVAVPVSFAREPVELPFSGDVTLTAFTAATFILVPGPTVVANPGTTATLTFTVARGSVPGTYPVTVTGTEPVTGLSHSVTFNITVQ